MAAVPFRFINSGMRACRLQIASGQALIDLHRGGEVPDTIRVLRVHPSVLVGRHQAIALEVGVEDCFADLVDIARRTAGGAAAYVDQHQLMWEVVVSRRGLPVALQANLAHAIDTAAAHGLASAFAIDAQCGTHCDIHACGQTVCVTTGFVDGGTLVRQGTVFIDYDPARALTYLTAPEAQRNISTITSLRALLSTTPPVEAVQTALLTGFSERLGRSITPATATAEEEALARSLYDNTIGSDEFVFCIDDPAQPFVKVAAHQTPGGTIQCFVRTDGAGADRTINAIVLAGDVLITPPRLITELEAALRGTAATRAAATVRAFFARATPDTMTITPVDVETVVAAALSMPEQ